MDERNSAARPSAEYSARTVPEALKRAAEALGVPAEALEYEVVRDSSHSILGLVRTGEVVIRVWLPTSAAGKAEKPASPAALPAEEEDEGAAARPPRLKVSPAELERITSEVVSTLLDKMGILAAVEVVERGGVDPATNESLPLMLNIVGDDLSALIGRRGETLGDLQFITRLIVSRKVGGWPNIVVDVEGYKSKRVDILQALARRMADQVRKTKRAIVLEPMPAHERRVIHLALRDDPDVYTESTGEDEQRKVQILPKR